MEDELIVIGGGLAGCEAAWQAAERGVRVRLYEMRPGQQTGAHLSDRLAELVCSNSLGSSLPDRASGLLKNELKRLGSLLLVCAENSAVPAGSALAVDRELFSMQVTEKISAHPYITLVREEVETVPDGPTVIASGPLTSGRLSQSIAQLTGAEQLFFYDAVAPIVAMDTIDFEIAYRKSRFGRGEQAEGDYINCPMDRDQYEKFLDELVHGERIAVRGFESAIEQGVDAGSSKFFEGCLPIEVMARRGPRALTFGPLRPIGLVDPRTGKRPYAVVQLRQDNLAGSLYNLVGFQTNLTYAEQKRVFHLIPGLEHAEFVRYGQMHRNTFITSPRLLEPSLKFIDRSDLWFAGQITGVEGYMGNVATGLLAGINAARHLRGEEPWVLPTTTMIGALCHYVTHASLDDFQPMKANFGIFPPLELIRRATKGERAVLYSQRALQDLDTFLAGTQMYINK